MDAPGRPAKRDEPWKRYTRAPSVSTTQDLSSSSAASSNGESIDPDVTSPGVHKVLFGEEARRSHHRSPFRWTGEFVSLLAGVAVLLVIVIVLTSADGRAAPQWPLGITLNTLLAFLAAFAKIAFMCPIVEGIGQLKWMWFTSPDGRPLNDFRVFDEASRGSWGSVKLLARSKGTLACLGALVTVSGFLTSTLTQQAIGYRQLHAETKDGFATVARATSCSLYNGTTLDIRPWAAVREKQALVTGAFHVPDEPIPHTAPDCSSGECLWEPYGTLGVCSEVVNLTAAGRTDLIANLTATTSRRADALFNRTALFIADGLTYSIFPSSSVPPSFPVIIGPMAGPTGSLNKSVSELLLSSHFLAYSDSLLTGATARGAALHFLEISFYWCTKTLSTAVEAGVPRTTQHAAVAEVLTPDPHVLNFAWAPDFAPCYAASTCDRSFGGSEVELRGPPNATTRDRYSVNVWTSLVGSIVIGETMYDSILMDATRGIVTSTGGGIAESFAASLFGDYMATRSPPPDVQLQNIKGLVHNMEVSMTNYLRQEDSRYQDGNRTTTAFGTVFAPQTFVKIRWEYIVVLASQILLTSVFFACVVVSTHRSGIQILKGSSIATLCGLDKMTRRRLGDISDLSGLNNAAEKTAVRLERGSAGTALWLGPSPGPTGPTAGDDSLYKSSQSFWPSKGGDKLER